MAYEQPRWRFARMTPAEINQDPVQGEFFSREADLPGRLVREAIQNSLDAGREGQVVRVRFVFSGERDQLTADQAAPYVQGLRRHVEAVAAAGGMSVSGGADDDEGTAMEDALSCFEGPMTYLVVEDFGTTGLVGSIQDNSEREQGNDFWGFFRSIGISPKGENAAGSWGLGKWVFPDASIVNAYLGMTQRHGEDNWLVMGMALLKTHHLGNDKYRYYGSFAAHSNDADEEWFPLPVNSDDDPGDFILAALRDFQMERLEDPGLSVIVPYPKKELTPNAIVRAVLTQYFLPIVRGVLVVDVVHPELGTRTIDTETISEEITHIQPSSRDDESPASLRGVVRLAEWAVHESEHRYFDLPARNLTEAIANHPALEAMRERYERGERLAFRLAVDVKPRARDSLPASYFDLYLERDEGLAEGHDYFVRGMLRIPHMDHIRRQKARALLLVDGSSALGHMLRDAEGPAHESWDPNSQRLRDNWIGGQQRVNDVRRAAVHVLQALVERPAARQMDALADLFPGDPSTLGKGRSERGGGGSGPDVVVPPGLGRSPLQVDSPSGAVVVRAPRGAATPLADTTWELRFAYDTVRGNPFTLFDRGVQQDCPDFSLKNGNLHIVAEGCSHEVTADNVVLFTVTDEGEFRLAVSGFDGRDMKVEVKELQEVEESHEEDAA